MVPRSYEFTCKSCGRTVTESTDAEICGNCSMNMSGAAPGRPVPPPPPPAPAQKKGGVSFTIKIGPKCEFCGGKGTVGSQPCPKCGGKK